MRALVIAVATVAVPVTIWTAVSSAQSATCPPEVASAKAILTARGGDVQASAPGQNHNSLAAARSQDVQAPRSQDVQAPRSQDVQAPRNPNAASDTKRAETLVKEAEAACKTGDTARASEKAMAALDILRK